MQKRTHPILRVKMEPHGRCTRSKLRTFNWKLCSGISVHPYRIATNLLPNSWLVKNLQKEDITEKFLAHICSPYGGRNLAYTPVENYDRGAFIAGGFVV